MHREQFRIPGDDPLGELRASPDTVDFVEHDIAGVQPALAGLTEIEQLLWPAVEQQRQDNFGVALRPHNRWGRFKTLDRFDSRALLSVVLARDARLNTKLVREDLLPLGSRIRILLDLEPADLDGRDTAQCRQPTRRNSPDGRPTASAAGQSIQASRWVVSS